MSTRIHDNGYWLMDDKDYRFDPKLAKAISKWANNRYIETIIDIGCGNGSYTFYLRDNGFDVDGFDGNPYTPEITEGECMVLDFAKPVQLWPRDLVLCLEVAEHIPKEKELVFLHNIVDSQPDYIILSWAVEGQGGFGHVNCRDNDYVIKRMRSFGYVYLPEDTAQMRKTCKLKWFRESLMIYERLSDSV